MDELENLLEAVRSGDRRRSLEALRDQIAAKIDSGVCTHCGGPRGEASGIAALSLRLVAVMNEIDEIPAEEEVSERDDLAAQRAARRRTSASQDSLSTERGSILFRP